MLEILDVKLKDRMQTLQKLIADSYLRMATNSDQSYRKKQMDKCQKWLDEMTYIIQKGELKY